MEAYNKWHACRTGIKMMLAGLIAFFVYHKLNWPFGFWSVVTIAAVVRPGLEQTLAKALMRIIGTLIGGFAALGLLYISPLHMSAFITLFFVVIFFSSFLALQKTLLSYMGIMIGLTTTIVCAASLMGHAPLQTMLYRFADVGIGIGAITLVNVVLRLCTPKHSWFQCDKGTDIAGAFKALVPLSQFHKDLKPAIATAAAASLTLLPWLHLQYLGGFWATISCFFIMEESLQMVEKKSMMRFWSHLIAALVGGVAYLMVAPHTFWLFVPLVMAFFVFGFLMVSSKTLSQAGNTMAIALSVMLLADTLHYHTDVVIMARFFNVMAGVIIGMVLSYWVGVKN